jgi:hypothetical protein
LSKKKKRNKFTDLIKPIVDNLFFKVLDIKKSTALFFFFLRNKEQFYYEILEIVLFFSILEIHLHKNKIEK